MTQSSRRTTQSRSRGGTKRQSPNASTGGRRKQRTTRASSSSPSRSTAARARSRKAANRNRPRRAPRTPVSKSVGAVVLNQNLKVLLVFQNKNKYWEFPKGKMEGGEREIETLRREIEEETGITRFQMLPRFRRTMQYDFQYQGKRIRREVIYFLIRTTQRVRVSDEHSQYKWLTFDQAKKYLKHDNQVKLLEEVQRRMKMSQVRGHNGRKPAQVESDRQRNARGTGAKRRPTSRPSARPAARKTTRAAAGSRSTTRSAGTARSSRGSSARTTRSARPSRSTGSGRQTARKTTRPPRR